MVKDFIAKN